MRSKIVVAFGLSMIAAVSAHAADLVIATVNNGHMIEMQKHTKEFEAANPGITLKWVTLEEGVLRHERLTWTGHIRDTVSFSILRDEWAKQT